MTKAPLKRGASVDCKTVVFFANASDGDGSLLRSRFLGALRDIPKNGCGDGPSLNERSGASVKTAKENVERR